MEAQDVQKIVAEALKADREAREAETTAKAARQAEIDAAVKAEHDKLEAEYAKERRLPLGAPYATKFGFATKYDHLTPAEHALVIDILNSPHNGVPKNMAGPEILRALALKVESEAAKNDGAAEAFKALKAGGFKSDEIMHTDLSSYGSQWVGTLYSRQIWEQIRAECWILQKLGPYSDQIPDGYSSDTVPVESTDPVWYKVAEAASNTSGYPDVTVTASQVTTASGKNITVAKMGCRVQFSGELVEDSLVPLAAQIMRQIKASGMEQFEHVIIDGDTETSSSANINNSGGAMSATATYALLNGFRKLALVTNTANSRAGGALGDEDFLATMQLLGTAGINADINKCSFIVDMPTYWKAMQMANVMTRDVFGSATLEKGQLTGLWGYELKPSAFMHYKGTVRKADALGYVNQTAPTLNVCGAILAVRWDQWRLKWKRQMTIETARDIKSDSNEIVAMARWGLGYRDTEAAAITYGITGV